MRTTLKTLITKKKKTSGSYIRFIDKTQEFMGNTKTKLDSLIKTQEFTRNTKTKLDSLIKHKSSCGTPKPRVKIACNEQKKPHVDWTYIYISHIFLCKILHLCKKKHIYLLQDSLFYLKKFHQFFERKIYQICHI